ncbi:hypothetical protein BD626DRAFT_79906 [Schizophyllum amplum]|uniref:Uncharacterized protein n=1 Tax=Schizophyllum amplum TaxID=97359 RepID=A0A550CA60_9AGAR|nr:hypothetical protein BD626DRAFT_79906 [Auriculariopsis ampla]
MPTSMSLPPPEPSLLRVALLEADRALHPPHSSEDVDGGPRLSRAPAARAHAPVSSAIQLSAAPTRRQHRSTSRHGRSHLKTLPAIGSCQMYSEYWRAGLCVLGSSRCCLGGRVSPSSNGR